MAEDSNVIREIGRLITGGYYDHQQIRISEWNRIRDIIRKVNEDIDFSKPEEKKEDKKYSKEYKDANLPHLLEKLHDEGKLSKDEYNYIEKALSVLKEAEKYENRHKGLMETYINSEEIWYNWLVNVRGIGPVIAANLIKNFGYCETFRHASSLWKYCGLHVVDGKAPKRQKGKKLDYKLSNRAFSWNIGESFVKQRTYPYREIYDLEKARRVKVLLKCRCENCGEPLVKRVEKKVAGKIQVTHPVTHKTKKDGKKGVYYCKDGNTLKKSIPESPMSMKHADNMARRKMEKIFLQNYWKTAREMKGLPIDDPYIIEHGKHRSYIEPVGVKRTLKPKEKKQEKKGSKKD